MADHLTKDVHGRNDFMLIRYLDSYRREAAPGALSRYEGAPGLDRVAAAAERFKTQATPLLTALCSRRSLLPCVSRLRPRRRDTAA